MQKVKVCRCPVCGKLYKSVNVWGKHLNEMHKGTIPNGWPVERYLYYMITGKSHGTCIVCKSETDWNTITKKYQRFCNNPKCKEQYREEFKKRMISKHGKVSLLDDPEHQRKMLAAKKISGKYKFTNDKESVGYTGTYEKDFLEMLDKLLLFNSNDIMGPSPHTYYYDYVNENDKENEGRKFFIPDFFIPSINLEIEIKQSTNTHPKLLKIDKVKEDLKDEAMKANPVVNYIKIVDKDYTEFFNLIDSMQMTDKGYEIVTESNDIVSLEEPKSSKLVYIPLTKELINSSLHPEIKYAHMHEYPNFTGGEVILDGDKFIAVYQTRKLKDDNWLLHIYFNKEIRDTNIEKRLRVKILNRAKITNVQVNTEDTYLIEFYQSYGYKIYIHTDKYVCLSNLS